MLQRGLFPVTAAILALAVSAQAKVVSTNLVVSVAADNDIQNIVEPETFGVGTVFGFDTTVGNWTNTKAASRNNLRDKSGVATTVDYSITVPGGWGTFNSNYGNTPLVGGMADYTPTATPSTATLSDLNATFPGGYFAIVYLGAFNSNRGAWISDGTITYYYQGIGIPTGPVTTFTQTTQTTDLGDDLNPEAQYAVFGSNSSALTADSTTFTIRNLYGGGVGLCGVQLVGIADGNVVSVNFSSIPPNAETIAGTETYGLGSVFGVNTTVGNWNNTNAISLADLIDSDGAPTTVAFSGTKPAGADVGAVVYDDTPMRAGNVTYSGATAYPTATFTNLSTNFPNGYFAIVYMSGFATSDGASISSTFDSEIVITSAVVDGSDQFVIDYTGLPSANYEVKKSADLGSFVSLTTPVIDITAPSGAGQAIVPAGELGGAKQFFILEDSPTNYFWQALAAPVGAAPTRTTQPTDLGSGLNPEAEYAIFGSDTAPLSADTVTFTVKCLYGGGVWLGGVQLVGLPTP